MTGLDNLFISLSSGHKNKEGKMRLVGFQRFLGPFHFCFTFYFMNFQPRLLIATPSPWFRRELGGSTECDAEILMVLGVAIIG